MSEDGRVWSLFDKENDRLQKKCPDQTAFIPLSLKARKVIKDAEKDRRGVQYCVTVIFKIIKLVALEPFAGTKRLLCKGMKGGHTLQGEASFYREPISAPEERTLILPGESI